MAKVKNDLGGKILAGLSFFLTFLKFFTIKIKKKRKKFILDFCQKIFFSDPQNFKKVQKKESPARIFPPTLILKILY